MATPGPCSQRRLAEWIGHSEPAVSRMLGTLGRAGLVTSTVDEAHRRRNAVALTEMGAAADRRAGGVLGEALASLMSATGVDEAALLDQALRLREALASAGRRSRPLGRS